MTRLTGAPVTVAWGARYRRALTVGMTLITPLDVAAPAYADVVALTGDGFLALAVVPAVATAPALTGAGSLTVAGAPSWAVPIVLTGTGQLAITGGPAYSGAVALTGTGLLGLAVVPSPAASVALTGAGSLTVPTRTPAVSGAVPLTGTGSLTTAQTGLAVSAAPALTGTGSLALAGAPAVPVAVALSGDGILALAVWTAGYVGTAKVATMAEATTTATTLQGGTPPALADGDLVICTFTTTTTPADSSISTGWTAMPITGFTSGKIGIAGGAETLGCFYRRLAAGEAATFTPPTVTAGAAGRMSVSVIAYANVDATTPLDVTGQSATASTTSVAVPSITTATANARIFGAAGMDASVTSNITPPAQMTLLSNTTGTGRKLVVAQDTTDPAAGATGTRTWTETGTTNLSISGFTVALRPSGVSVPAFAGTVALTGTGTLTPAPATLGAAGTGALAATGVLSLAVVPSVPVAVPLAATGQLSLAVVPAVARPVPLSGTGSLSLAVVPRPAGTPTLTSTGSLTFAVVPAAAGAVTLAGDGQLALDVAPGMADVVTLTGDGLLVVAPPTLAGGTADLSTEGVLTLDVVVSTASSPALSTIGVLSFLGQTVATVSAVWHFATTAEGFTATNAGGTTLTYDAATGNPAGALRAAVSGRNTANATAWWEWTGTAQSLGVPAGSDVVSVQLASAYTRVLTATTPRASTQVGPYELRDAAGTLLGALWSGRTFTAVDAGWVQVTAQTAVSATITAGSNFRIRLADTLGTGNNTSASVVTYDDEVNVALSYLGTPQFSTTYPLTGEGALTAGGVFAPAAIGGTAALTGSGSLSLAAVPAVAGAAQFTSTGSLTVPTRTPAVAGAVVLAATGSLSVAGAPALAGAVTLTGSGSLTSVGAPSWAVPAQLSTTGTLTVLGGGTQGGTVALNAAGALTLAALVAVAGAAGLSGQGTLTISATGLTAAGTVNLSATGALTVPARTPAVAGGVTLSTTGTLTLTAVITAGGVATLSATGSLAVAGAGGAGPVILTATGSLGLGGTAVTVSAGAALTGVGTLALGAVPAAGGSAALTGTGALAVAGVPTLAGAGAFTAIGQLTVAGAPRLVGAVALSTTGTLLAGRITPVGFTATGALTLAGVPTPAGVAALTATGVLVLSALRPALLAGVALSMTGALSAAGTRVTIAGVNVALTAFGALGMAAIPVILGLGAFTGAGLLTVTGVSLGAVVRRPNLGRTTRRASGVTIRPDLGRTTHT